MAATCGRRLFRDPAWASGYDWPIGAAFLLGRGAMSRMSVAGLVAVVGLVASDGVAGAAEPAGRYAIVVRKDVAASPWGKVVRSLEAKYRGKVFAYDTSPDDVRRDV